MKIQPSEELAYWTGVLQTDGCLKIYKKWHKKSLRYIVSLGVGKCSPSMMLKFQKISNKLFGRNTKIFKSKSRELWLFDIGVKSLLDKFEALDIYSGEPLEPPCWAIKKSKFFGSYLAGVIDGDGSVAIKRPKYPQCSIRIFTSISPLTLSKLIETKIGNSTNIYKIHTIATIKNRLIKGECFVLEFYLSKKNFIFFKKFVIPQISIDKKRDLLEKFIKIRFER